jgi:hypothetical protein
VTGSPKLQGSPSKFIPELKNHLQELEHAIETQGAAAD